jgi:hypothetical protein
LSEKIDLSSKEDQLMILQGILLGKESTERFFGGIREFITQRLNDTETAAKAVKGDKVFEIMVSQNKTYFTNFSLLNDILEAISLNSVRDHELLSKLVDAYTTSDSETQTELEGIKNKVKKDRDEIKGLAKHKDNLEWINKYLKQRSETTTD